MDSTVSDILKECTAGSDDGRLTFPEVVMKLIGAGVEQYHADLYRAEKTYYMPNGEFAVVPCASIKRNAAENFSAAGVEAAVRGIQGRKIDYKVFCELIAAAGCVGYFVSIAGRRAVYYGRTCDSYVEPFPSAK